MAGRREACIAWPTERSERLREMWNAGFAASEIGDALGMSKSSVIGKARRDPSLPHRPNPIGLVGPRVKIPKHAPPLRTCAIPTLESLIPTAALPAAQWALGGRETAAHGNRHGLTGVTLSTVHKARLDTGPLGHSKECRWTDCTQAPWGFCGLSTLAGYSWCPAHKARVYVRAAA